MPPDVCSASPLGRRTHPLRLPAAPPLALTYLKLLATMVLWGGTFIAGRLLAGEVPPLSAAFVRFAIATGLLLTLLRRVEGRFPRLRRRQLGAVVLLGLTGVAGYNVCFFSGLQSIPAGRAALIIALNPVGIAVLSAFYCGEGLPLRKILGVLLSVGGALFVITDGNLANLVAAGIGRGELYLFGCVLCWSLYTIIGQRIMGGLSPLAAVSYSALAGVLLLLPLAAAEGVFGTLPAYSPRSWASLIYLGLCGTVVAFIWYYHGIRELGAIRAGVFINFVPVCAVLLSFLLLGE
ncbi:MAG TPA: DMT family transporter, partial [Deferrisomatales bacterium]|nr:DMT family transporter [Deferrisomatales bacterium]